MRLLRKKKKMDQLIVNIEPGANVAFIRKIIKNIKGIGEVVLKKDVEIQPKVKTMKKSDKNTEEWIRKMRELSNRVDHSKIYE